MTPKRLLILPLLTLLSLVSVISKAQTERIKQMKEAFTPCFVIVETDRMKGVGVFVDKNLVLTNYEVIAKATRGSIRVQGKEKPLDIIGTLGIDKDNDLALLKVNYSSDQYFDVINEQPAKNDKLYLFSDYENGSVIVSEETVKSLRSRESSAPVIVISTSQFNYRGGYPMINADGKLIGLTTSNDGLEKGVTMAASAKALYKLYTNRSSFVTKLTGGSDIVNFLPEKTSFPPCEVYSSQNNDKIVRTNGKELDVVIVDIKEDGVFYTKLNDKTNKVKFMSNDNIFSIMDDKKERLYYKSDTAVGNDFTINQMRCYVRGMGDARKYFKPVLITVGAVLVGLASPLVPGLIWIKISIPLVYAVLVALPNPKIKGEVEADLSKNPYYRQAYSNFSKNKKLLSSLVGGLGAFTISAIITQAFIFK